MRISRFIFLLTVGLLFKFQVNALSEPDCLELAGAKHAFQLDSKDVDLDKLVECLRVVSYEVLFKNRYE